MVPSFHPPRMRLGTLTLATTLLLVIALAAPALAAPADVRAWAGTITHDLAYRPGAEATVYKTLYGVPECHGVGAGVVIVDLDAGSFKLLNPDSECIPGFTTLSTGCTLDADEHVRCAYDSTTVHIHADVAPDGAFLFTYDDPHFQERIAGQLARAA